MKNLREDDRRLVSRFVDGELQGDAAVEFERRLLQEPALRDAVDEQRSMRQWMAKTAGEPQALSAGFTDRVLQEARRLPTRESLLHEADVPGEIERNERSAVRLTQVLMGAAAAILVTTVLFSSDLMRATDSRHLDAVDTKRIEEIDQEITAEERRREAENRRR